MTIKTFDAQVNQLDNVIEFIENELKKYDCSFKVKISINIAVEEIFANLCHYAYPNIDGTVDISIVYDNSDNSINICISDFGIKFNPLECDDPDITLSAQDREIGGLGIFICKKTMDKLSYEYKNRKNNLYIKKIIK